MSERIYTAVDVHAMSVEDSLRMNQRAYFGCRGANPESICCMIANGALVLGARRVLVSEQRGWWYICADFDWLKASTTEGVGPTSAFETIWPFPEAGEKAFRCEVFCRLFSRRAFSVSGFDVFRVTGDLPSDEQIASQAAQLGEWQRVVGFVFDDAAAQ